MWKTQKFMFISAKPGATNSLEEILIVRHAAVFVLYKTVEILICHELLCLIKNNVE